MSSLFARLAKAKSRLLGTAPQEIAVPFELACDCGHRVTGIRRTSYQLATCSACHNSVYVLPVNVYPATRRVKSDVVDGPLVSKISTVVRELLMGDSPAAEVASTVARPATPSEPSVPAYAAESPADSEPTGRKRRRRDTDGREAAVPTSDQNSSTGVPGPLVVPLARKSFGTRLRRIFSPTRLLALAGIAVLVSTGWWTMHQRQTEQARKNWRSEMDRAEDALKRRDLVTLYDSLLAAVKAAHTLKRSDTDVRIAESLLQQTEAVQKLSSLDLVSLMAAAVLEDGRTLDSSKANDVCSSLSGQYMVFEAALRPGEPNQNAARLDFPLVINNQPVRILVDSAILTQYAQANPALPLLFTARLSTCTPPSGPDSEWLIVLDGTTCSLITTEFHAFQLGFGGKMIPDISATVQRQGKFLRTRNVGRSNSPAEDKSAGVATVQRKAAE